jgi:GNAT superfamily N-acetyltransferase
MIRPANPEDLPQIEKFDGIMAVSNARRDAAIKAIEQGRALVVESGGVVIGYGYVHHEFYGRTFIDLVYIAEQERNWGWGPKLMSALEGLSRSAQIFTSTNESNLHMQHVLAKAGYRRVGKFDELDPGDPELIYVKQLQAI